MAVQVSIQLFKPSGAELKTLKAAARSLRYANKAAGTAKAAADAAKRQITDWLQEAHKINLETLAIEDMIQIHEVALIEIQKANRFDEEAFAAADPTLHAKFKKDFPRKVFKPLA